MTSHGEAKGATDGGTKAMSEFLATLSSTLRRDLKYVDGKVKSENREWPPGKLIRAETYAHGIVLVEDGWGREPDEGRASGSYVGRRLILRRDGVFAIQVRTGRWDPETQEDHWAAETREVDVVEAASMVSDPADLLRRVEERLSKGADAVEKTVKELRARQQAFRAALEVVGSGSDPELRDVTASIKDIGPASSAGR